MVAHFNSVSWLPWLQAMDSSAKTINGYSRNTSHVLGQLSVFGEIDMGSRVVFNWSDLGIVSIQSGRNVLSQFRRSLALRPASKPNL